MDSNTDHISHCLEGKKSSPENIDTAHYSHAMIIYVTVFGKTNQLVRKSVVVYAWKWSFEHEDANGNKEKEECLT